MQALHHIGYWVEDLAQAAARTAVMLGIGPFLVHEHVSFDEFRYADGRSVVGDDHGLHHFDHSAAFAAWGPLVIELGQIHQIDSQLESAYRVNRSGPGHVSWVVDDLKTESDRLAQLGCRLIHNAGSGAVRVAWHEGGALFGHPIEIHQSGGPIMGMHARLTALAENWDGQQLLRPMTGGPS